MGARLNRLLAMQPVPGRIHRRLAGPELFRLHLAGLEVVADVLAHPDLLPMLDANRPLGGHLLQRPVHADPVCRQDRVAVADQDAVGAGSQAGVIIVFNPAPIRQRFKLQVRALLPTEHAREGDSPEDEHDDGAELCHSARGAKQNGECLPSNICPTTPTIVPMPGTG